MEQQHKLKAVSGPKDPFKKDQSGKYKKVESYVKGMVKDRSYLEWQMKEWFPEYLFTESQVYYNDFNGMFYIRARMRKRREIP